MHKKTHILMILDGWGISPGRENNAVAAANTPFLDKMMASYPVTRLVCSGEAVGLPAGIMGNSEVGHLNIGAGRIVYQDLLRIDNAIKDGSFFENEAINKVVSDVKHGAASLHLMGLVSDGGVHSQLTHLFALLDLAKKNGLENVFVHAILDGRDTPPDGGKAYVQQLENYMAKINCGKIATVCGRYWAMDRDKRWDRIEKAYRLYTRGEGRAEPHSVEAVQHAYDKDETDEFVTPIVIHDDARSPMGLIGNHDGVIFFNFRADRARQITRAFTDTGFKAFDRGARPELCGFVTMTLYDEGFALPMAFPPVRMEQILGEVVSKAGLSQLRIAETEKYAHVTYFFNGGEEKPFLNEDRCLIPSPRDVATYDLKPEMSALDVAEKVVGKIESGTYDLIILNFANMDMVGHTGVFDAAVKACETVDHCVEKVVSSVLANNGVAMITADHGNSEKMADDDGKPFTAHTTNPVRFILVDEQRKGAVLKNGKLGDIAPTILDLMGIEKPDQMTGESLL